MLYSADVLEHQAQRRRIRHANLNKRLVTLEPFDRLTVTLHCRFDDGPKFRVVSPPPNPKESRELLKFSGRRRHHSCEHVDIIPPGNGMKVETKGSTQAIE